MKTINFNLEKPTYEVRKLDTFDNKLEIFALHPNADRLRANVNGKSNQKISSKPVKKKRSKGTIDSNELPIKQMGEYRKAQKKPRKGSFSPYDDSDSDHLYDEDDKDSGDSVFCMSCYDCDYNDDDEILLCDKCDMSVHQSCYGVPIVPKGEWLCSPCAANYTPDDLECELCSKKGGALSECTVGPGGITPVSTMNIRHRWCHTVCGQWISEAVRNETEPVTFDVSHVPKGRFRLKCSLCKRTGCCVQCTKSSCYTAVHPLCISSAGKIQGWKVNPLYCPKHAAELTTTVDSDEGSPTSVELIDSTQVNYRSSQDFNPLIDRLATASLLQPKRLFAEYTSHRYSEDFLDRIAVQCSQYHSIPHTISYLVKLKYMHYYRTEGVHEVFSINCCMSSTETSCFPVS